MKKLDGLHKAGNCIVQEYINRPLLIDGLKFDLRIYVLLAGCDPLRIFIHEEGLARFATEEYKAPNVENMADIRMHLTNYAVNKFSEKFVQPDEDDEDTGHKRSLASILEYLENQGHDVDDL